jgi:hypothetical protein
MTPTPAVRSPQSVSRREGAGAPIEESNMSDTTENYGILRRGETVVKFTDQYGDQRIIHRLKDRRLSVKRQGNTPAHALNRAAAVLLGSRIKQCRIAAGLTMEELCVRAGLAAAPGQGKMRIYEIENAKRREGVRIGTLFALAIALNVPISDLLPSSEEVAAAADVSFGSTVGLKAP